jgi:hypothetical protein
MRLFYRLIIPEPIEAIVLVIISISIMLIENIKRFWMMLQGDSVIIVNQSSNTENLLSDYVRGLQQFVSPKLVDFLLWALIGCFVFVVISLIIAFFKTLDKETELLHYYRSPIGKAHELNSFLTKLAIRVIGVLSMVLYFGYFTRAVNPYLVKLFFDSITSLKDPVSWLWLFISIALFTASLYIFVLLIRLIALKPRIFGTESEVR